MKRRSRVSGSKSRKMFKSSANRTHRANVTPRPQRGGGRL